MNGRQYVAVTGGSGGPFTHTWLNLVPDNRQLQAFDEYIAREMDKFNKILKANQ